MEAGASREDVPQQVQKTETTTVSEKTVQLLDRHGVMSEYNVV